MVRKIVLAAVAVAVIVSAYFIFFRKTEEDRIRNQFKSLAEYATRFPGETGTTMLYKAKVVGNLFDDYCDLTAEDDILSGHYSREDISGKSLMLRRNMNSAIITFHDLTIESVDDKKAKVKVSARLNAKDSSSNAIDQTREMDVILLKKDGKWLFSDFTITRILKKQKFKANTNAPDRNAAGAGHAYFHKAPRRNLQKLTCL